MTDDPVAAVDALVADVDHGLTSPGVESRDVVVVTGPWLAGATSLIAALRDRLPEQVFVEAEELGYAEAPAAVVFVVSAMAPLTESDCALVDLAATHTDLVVGVVSKIDAHRSWRDKLAADRTTLAAWSPRYRQVDWAGVAAAPEQGDPDLTDLVDILRRHLGSVELARRNRLRAWESRLQTAVDRHHSEVVDDDARASVIRQRRDEALAQGRLAKSERAAALERLIAQARVQLADFALNRCSSVQTELQEDAAGMTRRRIPQFEPYVRGRVDEVVGEVDQGVTKHLGDLVSELGLSGLQPAPPAARPDVPAPPLRSRRLLAVSVMLLGAGLGAGVAFGVSRFFPDLSPALIAGALAAAGVVGLAVALWAVGVRGRRQDRAVLEQWITEVTSTLRSALEQLVATRVQTAETELSAQLNARDEAESAVLADRIDEIDAELREHAVAKARAAAQRNRRLPPLQRALEAVRAELSDAVPAVPGADPGEGAA
jgi:hypothetical protein